MNKISIFAVLAFATAALLFQVGCAPAKSDEGDPAVTDSTFTGIYNASFSVTCVNCHSPGASAYVDGVNIDFSTKSNARSDLQSRTVASPASPNSCPQVRIVVANDVANSYLMGVLFSQYNKNNFGGVNGCQPPYNSHLNHVNLSAQERVNIAAWISAGAPNN